MCVPARVSATTREERAHHTLTLIVVSSEFFPESGAEGPPLVVPKGSLRGGPSRHRGLANSKVLQPLLFSSATLAPSPSPQPQPKTTFLGNPDTGHWRSERGIAYLKLRPVEFGATDLGAGNDSGNSGTQASDRMTYLETGTARNWALGTGNQELGA